ncbi:MAG: diguanylate cyclase domain-containing protein [Cyanobium sp.]
MAAAPARGVNPAASIDPTVAQRLRALAPQDLELRFHPILLLRDPGRCALELLVRFRPPDLAALGTAEVVRCAEALDLVHRLDQLVFRSLEGVQQAWRDLGELRERIAYISINISAGSVASAQREDALIALIRQLRIDPGLFRFELSETAAMEERPWAGGIRSVSQRLIEELEIHLLVDDFGSWLCNYRRLCEAWYDTIKLDLRLVQGIAGSFRMQTFVGSLIQAVHGLGRTVVAEGVEERRDLEELLRLGVDAVQGYLVAMPLPWEELETFLNGSPWLTPDHLQAISTGLLESDARIRAPLLSPQDQDPSLPMPAVPLERYVLHHWSGMRNFEEVLLCYLRELQSWNLDVLRLSFAFLPDQEEVDCSQFIWNATRPGEVQSMRMQRDFLQTVQHQSSVLHHIATRTPIFRLRLAEVKDAGFDYLEQLRHQGGSDYLGLRLSSRGISTPVLSICLRGDGMFSDAQVERIEALSNLLSLLFHAFECERASRLALLDPLTDLPNRRSFDSRIRAEAVAAATTGRPLALVLIDIDRFKLVNDNLGHAYGDTCLSQVAAVLHQQLKGSGSMVARLGGEEFGVVLADTGASEGAAIAERMRRAVAEAAIGHPAPVNGIGLTISLGLASWMPGPGASLDLDTLLQLADDCLYAAKREGRDRLVGGAVPPSGSHPDPAL